MMDLSGIVPCPACGEAAAQKYPVIHHMVCATVGPSYDFPLEGNSLRCAKCRRLLTALSTAWEVIGHSLRCSLCGAETHL